MSDFCKMSPKEREKVIREQQKQEFTEFCKSYFTSFGWQWVEENSKIYVQRNLPALDRYEVIVTNVPHEEYPETKVLKKKIKESNIVLVAPELSVRWRGRGVGKVDQHTASGINFTYLKG